MVLKNLSVQQKFFFVVKEDSSDYKKGSSLKNLWLNDSLWNQKCFFYGITVKNILKRLYFKECRKGVITFFVRNFQQQLE